MLGWSSDQSALLPVFCIYIDSSDGMMCIVYSEIYWLESVVLPIVYSCDCSIISHSQNNKFQVQDLLLRGDAAARWQAPAGEERMGLPRNPLPGQPPQLHGQVDSTSHLIRRTEGISLYSGTHCPRCWWTSPRRCAPRRREAAPSPSRGSSRPPSSWCISWSVHLMSCIVMSCDMCHVLSCVMYCQAAPLFGYLGDRYNRKFLLVLGMVILLSIHYLDYLHITGYRIDLTTRYRDTG